MKSDGIESCSVLQSCLDSLTRYLNIYDQICPATRQYSFSYESGRWVAMPKHPVVKSGNGYYERNLQKLLTYIEEHYNCEISESFAAEIIGLSVSEFCRFFKKQMGLSFVPYINKVRIAHACRLLAETEYSCELVGLDCGYSSYSYFKRVFERNCGVSPKQYRIQLNEM